MDLAPMQLPDDGGFSNTKPRVTIPLERVTQVVGGGCAQCACDSHRWLTTFGVDKSPYNMRVPCLRNLACAHDLLIFCANSAKKSYGLSRWSTPFGFAQTADPLAVL
jgi:hypothetical protein